MYEHCPPLARIDSVEREPFIWSQLPTEFTIRQKHRRAMNTQSFRTPALALLALPK
ncbi:hypothetical protein ACNKHW_17105 [Shigella flexneri]